MDRRDRKRLPPADFRVGLETGVVHGRRRRRGREGPQSIRARNLQGRAGARVHRERTGHEVVCRQLFNGTEVSSGRHDEIRPNLQPGAFRRRGSAKCGDRRRALRGSDARHERSRRDLGLRRGRERGDRRLRRRRSARLHRAAKPHRFRHDLGARGLHGRNVGKRRVWRPGNAHGRLRRRSRRVREGPHHVELDANRRHARRVRDGRPRRLARWHLERGNRQAPRLFRHAVGKPRRRFQSRRDHRQRLQQVDGRRLLLRLEFHG